MDDIKKVIEDYFNGKKQVQQQAKELRNQATRGEKNSWAVERQIDELHKDRYDSEAAKKYRELAEKASNDDEFEKKFGDTFNEVFKETYKDGLL